MDGVGAHPTAPIVTSPAEWRRYVDEQMPAIANAYRGKMTFFGGIDVQFNLIHGTRESIREEVRTLMDDFHAHDGKYIASPSNSIMPETPIDNVRYLFEAIREFGDGS